jgi:hypothetical protein
MTYLRSWALSSIKTVVKEASRVLCLTGKCNLASKYAGEFYLNYHLEGLEKYVWNMCIYFIDMMSDPIGIF